MAKWLWWLQSDTLGSNPAVAGFSLSPFSPSRLKITNEVSKTISMMSDSIQ